MPTMNPTNVKELVAYLSKSNLPTIVVEGRDDMRIYNWAKENFDNDTATVLPVGSRSKLLAVYDRREEFKHLPVAFVADRDMDYLFKEPSNYYKDIVWTEGYSVENDLYAGGESILKKLLNQEEDLQHKRILETLIEWFAFEVEEFSYGRYAKVNRKLKDIVPDGQTKMDENFRECRGFRSPNASIHQKIKEAYQLRLRGKFLFQMLHRVLADNSRDPRYNLFSLYEMAFKLPNLHPWRDRLIEEIEQTLDKQQRNIEAKGKLNIS